MSNFLRTIQQVTRDYVDSISHRLPSIKNGTVTATSSDGTATVRVDGNTATTSSVTSIAKVKTGDRVKMVLFNRQLTILGAIRHSDKLLADGIEGGLGGRNLVLNSNPSISIGTYNVIQGRLSEPWVDGATYTVTIKGTVNTPNHFRLYRDIGMAYATALTYDAGRGVYTATFVCPPRYQDRNPYEFSVYNYPSATATSASIEWIKIERGSVATDWTLAPEDCQTHDEYLYTTTNTKSIEIGPRNASHCHYQTTAPSHYFNTKVLVNGEIRAGSGYNKLVWHEGDMSFTKSRTSGTLRLPNNLRLCWGYFEVSGSGWSVVSGGHIKQFGSQYFAGSFSEPPIITLQTMDGQPGARGAFCPYVYAGTTSFQGWLRAEGTGTATVTSNAIGVYYTAIGFA